MSSSKSASHTLSATTDINSRTQLIYAGGTFGCYGRPLSPIAESEFLPIVERLLAEQFLPQTSWLPNTLIKDSSQLTPSDFVHFYQLILTAYASGQRSFVLITGTDSLSYLSTFLAEAFVGSDICIVVTGSMRPLFDPNHLEGYVVDSQSDAWGNLTDSIKLAAHGEPGVRVCFAGESWQAQTVQKIHSHDFMAFTGHRRAAYPANSYSKILPDTRRQHWLDDQMGVNAQIIERSTQAAVYPLYCMPNDSAVLELQLRSLIDRPASGIILIGFGAGNATYSPAIAELLNQAYQRGHLVVSASQCAFGGVGETYAAGSWQYEHHVISGGRLTLPAIFARLLWLHLRFDTPARRRQRWTHCVNQATLVRS